MIRKYINIFNNVLENSWYRYKDLLKVIMSRAISHEYSFRPDTQRRKNVSEFYNICDEYFHWLAYMLHKYEFLSEDTIADKLEELGL